MPLFQWSVAEKRISQYKYYSVNWRWWMPWQWVDGICCRRCRVSVTVDRSCGGSSAWHHIYMRCVYSLMHWWYIWRWSCGALLMLERWVYDALRSTPAPCCHPSIIIITIAWLLLTGMGIDAHEVDSIHWSNIWYLSPTFIPNVSSKKIPCLKLLFSQGDDKQEWSTNIHLLQSSQHEARMNLSVTLVSSCAFAPAFSFNITMLDTINWYLIQEGANTCYLYH